MSDRAEGEYVEDVTEVDRILRCYRSFSLTENELLALRWAPFWTRLSIIRRVIAETTFPVESTPDGQGTPQ